MRTPLFMQSRRLKDCLILFFGFSLLFTFNLGKRPFASPDEGRYVEIPREMTVSGDYLTPHLNGLPYFEKPPLFYWLQSGVIKCLGLSEFSMRLLPVLTGLLGLILTYIVASHFVNRRTGLISAAVLGTSFLYFSLSRMIVLDLLFAFLMAVSMWSFVKGVLSTGKSRLYSALACSLFLALALLTKGLVALVIFFSVTILWLLITNSFSRLKPLYFVPCLLLFLLVAAPWHVFVSLENPEFFNFYFIREHFLRYTTKMHVRYQPIWFFVPIVVVGFFPWTSFLIKAAINTFKKDTLATHTQKSVEKFALIWFIYIFIFFSLSSSKLITYMMPLFFPGAYLIGTYIAKHLKNQTVLKVDLLLHSCVCVALIGIYAFFRHKIPMDMYNLLEAKIKLLLLTFILGALLPPFFAYLKKPVVALSSLLVLTFVQLGILLSAEHYLDRISAKKAASAMREYAKGEELTVYSYGHHYQDLAVYLQQPIKIIDHTGELGFSQAQAPHRRILYNAAEASKEWENSLKPQCVIFKKGRLPYVKTHTSLLKKSQRIFSDSNSYVYCKP